MKWLNLHCSVADGLPENRRGSCSFGPGSFEFVRGLTRTQAEPTPAGPATATQIPRLDLNANRDWVQPEVEKSKASLAPDQVLIKQSWGIARPGPSTTALACK